MVRKAVLFAFNAYDQVELIDGSGEVLAYGYVVDDEPFADDDQKFFPEQPEGESFVFVLSDVRVCVCACKL